VGLVSGPLALSVSSRPIRVLVVDDEPAVRSLLSDLLTFVVGAETVDVAEGGASALALFDRHRYDLVLTDLLMPGMQGWDVADALRARDPGVNLIMLTGSATDEDIRRARACGFPVLSKPISVADFKVAIEAALPQDGAAPA
jgi:CheY-like chemotaxis protein